MTPSRLFERPALLAGPSPLPPGGGTPIFRLPSISLANGADGRAGAGGASLRSRARGRTRARWVATFAQVKRQLRGDTFEAIKAAAEEDPMGGGWLHAETQSAAQARLSRRREH
jgi:hypothetical protein